MWPVLLAELELGTLMLKTSPVVRLRAEMEAMIPVLMPVLISNILADVVPEPEAMTLKMVPVVRFRAEMEAIVPVVTPVLMENREPVKAVEEEALISKSLPEDKAEAEIPMTLPVFIELADMEATVPMVLEERIANEPDEIEPVRPSINISGPFGVVVPIPNLFLVESQLS